MVLHDLFTHPQQFSDGVGVEVCQLKGLDFYWVEAELASVPGLQHPYYQGELSITSLAMSSKCCSLQGGRASSDSHTLMACSPTPMPAGPDLLGCPGKVKSPLSLVLQQIRGRDGFPALMIPGPALLPASGGKGQGRGGHLTHATTWQTSGEPNCLHSNP